MNVCNGWSFRRKKTKKQNKKKTENYGTDGASERVGTGVTKHKNHQKTIETKTDTDISGTLHCIVLSFSNFLATALQLRVQNINVNVCLCACVGAWALCSDVCL